MQSARPSQTALTAAAHRAAHQLLEGGRIFADPLAVAVLGEDAEEVARKARGRPDGRAVRLFIAARSRFAEDALAAAVTRGVRQLVLLGAGLDTYAYRGSLRAQLRIFEVDHPATQRWKQERLAAAGIASPATLTFAAIDFERQSLLETLAAAGFDASQQTFFTLLGVVPYLAESAVWSTLQTVAAIEGGAHVVFDYSDPPAMRTARAREAHERRAAHLAALGEPWITYFDPSALRRRLEHAGFQEIEDLAPRAIFARYAPQIGARVPKKGGHIIRASTIPQPPGTLV